MCFSLKSVYAQSSTNLAKCNQTVTSDLKKIELSSRQLNFLFFKDMFDRMPRDGRETQWRTLCESDQPELQPLPDKMDDHFNPVQRFLIVRAVRADRLMQASTVFIASVLGKKYVFCCRHYVTNVNHLISHNS